jgi:hypothetical protein
MVGLVIGRVLADEAYLASAVLITGEEVPVTGVGLV